MGHEPWTAAGYLATVLLLAGSAPAGTASGLEAQQSALAKGVTAIRRADYAGDRAGLRRLAGSLDAIHHPDLAPYRDYWIGFALWRRAINGFNETPTPSDLPADLEAATAAFRRALERKGDWLEPKIGLAGCASNLFYIARDDPARTKAIVDEYGPFFRDLSAQGRNNPRALWIVGGGQLAAPPPRGGHPDQAAATYRSALEAARAEALADPDVPVWVPRWGEPENLMALAYVYTNTPLRNRAVALAYAEGALAAVPHWHYMRDVLLPQVQALPETP
jgi:hypothetical protein